MRPVTGRNALTAGKQSGLVRLQYSSGLYVFTLCRALKRALDRHGKIGLAM